MAVAMAVVVRLFGGLGPTAVSVVPDCSHACPHRPLSGPATAFAQQAVTGDSMFYLGVTHGMQLARPICGPLLAIPPSKTSTVWRRVPTLPRGAATTRCDRRVGLHLAHRRGCAARAHFRTGNCGFSRASIAPQRASAATQLS